MEPWPSSSSPPPQSALPPPPPPPPPPLMSALPPLPSRPRTSQQQKKFGSDQQQSKKLRSTRSSSNVFGRKDGSFEKENVGNAADHYLASRTHDDSENYQLQVLKQRTLNEGHILQQWLTILIGSLCVVEIDLYHLTCLFESGWPSAKERCHIINTVFAMATNGTPADLKYGPKVWQHLLDPMLPANHDSLQQTPEFHASTIGQTMCYLEKMGLTLEVGTVVHIRSKISPWLPLQSCSEPFLPEMIEFHRLMAQFQNQTDVGQRLSSVLALSLHSNHEKFTIWCQLLHAVPFVQKAMCDFSDSSRSASARILDIAAVYNIHYELFGPPVIPDGPEIKPFVPDGLGLDGYYMLGEVMTAFAEMSNQTFTLGSLVPATSLPRPSSERLQDLQNLWKDPLSVPTSPQIAAHMTYDVLPQTGAIKKQRAWWRLGYRWSKDQ